MSSFSHVFTADAPNIHQAYLSNANAINLITPIGITPHPIPLTRACLPVSRGEVRVVGTCCQKT